MASRRVRLQCGHSITTTGDHVQPIKPGKLRWCGECEGWRAIDEVLS